MSSNIPELMTADYFDMETLIGMAEIVSSRKAGGHLTLMRFTSGWKAMIGTPDLDAGEGRGEVSKLKTYPTLQEALLSIIIGRA